MLIADYYAGSKTAHATVVFSILVDGRREHVSEIPVSGRRDARQQAAFHVSSTPSPNRRGGWRTDLPGPGGCGAGRG